MDNQRLKGDLKQTKGAIKEAIGKITGNRWTGLEGAAVKKAGKLQRALGKAAQAIRRNQ